MIKCDLKVVLHRKGKTQKWLADQLGVSPQMINRISTGKRPVTINRLNDFCRLLKCQPGDLLFYTEDEPTP